MNNCYKVPTIPQNLSKQDTIIQIAEVLDHLSNITDDVFARVLNRINEKSKDLETISARVNNVKTKIEKLSEAKNATQIYSSSKYPAADLNKPYKAIFHDLEVPEMVRHKVKLKNEYIKDEILDKLNIYHVHVKKSDKESGPVVGLGDIPSDIECLNDLLLYNSGKNLYKNFVMSDALDGSRQIKEQDLSDRSSIGAAPYSISDRSHLNKSSMQSYFYTPVSEEIPVLDVPLDLPDLPNIADNLRYDASSGPGTVIGPSATNSSVLETSHDVSHDNIPISKEQETFEPDIIELPSPPPPPPLPLVDLQTKNDEVPEEIAVPVEIPVEQVLSEQPKPEPIKLPQLDIRASLMDAIRKAGGSKNLKSTQNDLGPQPKIQSGGDLMADLHAKLSMRRKGISGTKNLNAMDASSALETISARIPPPVMTFENTNTENSTEDDEWDD